MKKIKSLFSSVRDSVAQNQLEPLKSASDSAKESADKIIEPQTSGLINSDGEISQNSKAFGFGFEHAHIVTFNANAELQNKNIELIRLPPNGIEEFNRIHGTDLPEVRKGEPDAVLIDKDSGEVLQTYQFKCYSGENADKRLQEKIEENNRNLEQVKLAEPNKISELDAQASDVVIVNTEREGFEHIYDNVQTTIEYDGISSLPVSKEMAELIAEDPGRAHDLLDFGSDAAESIGGLIGGGAFGGVISSIQESIKILARVYQGESIDLSIVRNSLDNVTEAIKSSSLRGLCISTLDIIINADNTSLPVIITVVGIDVYKKTQMYLKDELTLEELISQCGVLAVSKALVVVICTSFPPVGIALLGFSFLSTAWSAFAIDEKAKNLIDGNSMLKSINEYYGNMTQRGEKTLNRGKETITRAADDCSKSFTSITNGVRQSSEEAFNNSKRAVYRAKEGVSDSIVSASDSLINKMDGLVSFKKK